MPSVAPMIHVPDVAATMTFYAMIGFTVVDTYDDGCDGMSFAIVQLGGSRVMLNSGGSASTARRREVDLYVYTDEVDMLPARFGDRVQVVEPLHDTFYGMREFIIRDPNGFWITFGRDLEPMPSVAPPTTTPP